MPTLTTMPFPAAAALTENGAFGLVRVPGSGGGGSHDDPARGGRPAVPGGQAPDGGLAGCQASHGYPLGINGHLVPAAARVAGLELIWVGGGLPALDDPADEGGLASVLEAIGDDAHQPHTERDRRIPIVVHDAG